MRRSFPEEDIAGAASFADVVAAVASGRVDGGVLPIESSISGPVAETHDLLVDSATSIGAQAILPIRHFLVGVAEVPLTEIKSCARTQSRSTSAGGCSPLLPGASAIAAGTTADAAAQVARTAIRARSRSRASGRPRCDLVVLGADVGDHPEAFTRFVAISNRTQLDRRDWRIAFSFQPTTGRGAPPAIRRSRPPRPRPRPAHVAADSPDPGATASTPSSAAIRSTRWSARRSPGPATGPALHGLRLVPRLSGPRGSHSSTP